MTNKLYKPKIKVFTLLFLMMSLIFIIPINVASVYSADDGTKREDVAKKCGITPPLDVKSSLILSAVLMCLPGILEKIQEYREIQCRKVVCSYEAVKIGVAPTACEREKQFNTCKYIVGEVFAIPPMSIYKYLKQWVANIIANPIGVAWGVTAQLAREYANACFAKGGCSTLKEGVLVLFLGFTDITAAIQTFRDISENGFFPDFSGEDTCEQIEDIEKELKEIVKEQSDNQ